MTKLLCVILALAFCLSGCGDSSPKSVSVADSSAQETSSQIPIRGNGEIVVGCSLRGGLVLEETLSRLLSEEAHRLGLPIEFWFLDGKGSPEIQVSQIEYFISQKVDIIMLSPASYTDCDSAVTAAVNSDTPIITILSAVNAQQKATSYVGPETRKLAEEQCRSLIQSLGGKGRIAILEYSGGSGEQLDINAGYQQVLDEYPEIRVVARQTANANASEAYGIVDNWLYNDMILDAILAQNDSMALGAAVALNESIAWKRGEITSNIYGIDVNADGQEATFSFTGNTDKQAIERIGAIRISAIGGGDALPDTEMTERITDIFMLDENQYVSQIIQAILDISNGVKKDDYYVPAARLHR